jgi:hypothetical protein
MKYKFKIQEENKEIEEKEGMSFKKTLKSLVMTNPEWNGIIEYINKKGREVAHTIKKGKKI